MKNMEKVLASQGQSWKIMQCVFKENKVRKVLGACPFFKRGKVLIFWVLERSGNAFLLLYLFIVTLSENMIYFGQRKKLPRIYRLLTVTVRKELTN